MYFVDGNRYNEYSETNKKILKMFSDREARCCVTDMVEYILDTGDDKNAPPFTPEDIETNGEITCPYCGCASQFDSKVVDEDEVDVIEDSNASPEERYVCNICGNAYSTPEEAQQCCLGEEIMICQNCGNTTTLSEYDELEQNNFTQANEWWIVSPWLCDKLAERGEIVIQDYSIWGRQCKGSEVSTDSVIIEIAESIGILDGQEHSWGAIR